MKVNPLWKYATLLFSALILITGSAFVTNIINSAQLQQPAAQNPSTTQSNAPPEKPAQTASDPEAVEAVVYVTNTGKKYHRSSCRYLHASRIPMSLEKARDSYDACKVCHPPR